MSTVEEINGDFQVEEMNEEFVKLLFDDAASEQSQVDPPRCECAWDCTKNIIDVSVPCASTVQELSKWAMETKQALRSTPRTRPGRVQSLNLRYQMISLLACVLGLSEYVNAYDPKDIAEAISTVQWNIACSIALLIFIWSVRGLMVAIAQGFSEVCRALTVMCAVFNTNSTAVTAAVTSNIGVVVTEVSNYMRWHKYIAIAQTITGSITAITGLIRLPFDWSIASMARGEAVKKYKFNRDRYNRYGVFASTVMAALMFIFVPAGGFAKSVRYFTPIIAMLEKWPYVTWLIHFLRKWSKGKTTFDNIPTRVAEVHEQHFSGSTVWAPVVNGSKKYDKHEEDVEDVFEDKPQFVHDEDGHIVTVCPNGHIVPGTGMRDAKCDNTCFPGVHYICDNGSCLDNYVPQPRSPTDPTPKGCVKFNVYKDCPCRCHMSEEMRLAHDLLHDKNHSSFKKTHPALGSKAEKLEREENKPVIGHLGETKESKAERAKVWVKDLAQGGVKRVAAILNKDSSPPVVTSVAVGPQISHAVVFEDIGPAPKPEPSIASTDVIVKQAYEAGHHLSFKEMCAMMWIAAGLRVASAIPKIKAHVQKHKHKYMTAAAIGSAILVAVAAFSKSREELDEFVEREAKGKTKQKNGNNFFQARSGKKPVKTRRADHIESSGSEQELYEDESSEDELENAIPRNRRERRDADYIRPYSCSCPDVIAQECIHLPSCPSYKAIPEHQRNNPNELCCLKCGGTRCYHWAGCEEKYSVAEMLANEGVGYKRPPKPFMIPLDSNDVVATRSRRKALTRKIINEAVSARMFATPKDKATFFSQRTSIFRKEAALGKVIIDPKMEKAIKSKVYKSLYNGQVLSSATAIAGKICVPLHSFVEGAEPSVSNFITNVKLRKGEIFPVAKDLGFYKTYGQIPRPSKPWTMREVREGGEQIMAVFFADPEDQEPSISVGFASPNGLHDAATKEGACAGAIVAVADGALVGWPIGGGEHVNKFIPMTESIAKALLSNEDPELQVFQ